MSHKYLIVLFKNKCLSKSTRFQLWWTVPRCSHHMVHSWAACLSGPNTLLHKGQKLDIAELQESIDILPSIPLCVPHPHFCCASSNRSAQNALANHHTMMDPLWFPTCGFKSFCWTLAAAVDKDKENGPSRPNPGRLPIACPTRTCNPDLLYQSTQYTINNGILHGTATCQLES